MNKTQLAIMLTQERLKGQLDVLGNANLATERGIGLVKGIETYNKVLEESLAQVSQVKKLSTAKDNCWYCHGLGYSTHPLNNGGHPYHLCMICGATAMVKERYPVKHKPLYQPFAKLGREVMRLLGDARKSKLPAGYRQLSLPQGRDK